MSSKLFSFLFRHKDATVGTMKSVSKLHTTNVSSATTKIFNNGKPSLCPSPTIEGAPSITAQIKYTHHKANKNKPWILNGQQKQPQSVTESEWENKLLFKFKSCNDAVTFAVSQGWDYTIEQTASSASNLELS